MNKEPRLSSSFDDKQKELATMYRISHPLVSEQMITTDGQPNTDPMGDLPWSRNDIVNRATRGGGRQLTMADADHINTKLRRDAEEIDLSLSTLTAIKGELAKNQVSGETAMRKQKRQLADRALVLAKDKEYLEQRTEWLSGYSDWKAPGEPFDAEAVVNTHDAISQRILREKQPDGSTAMDMLHEQAANLDRVHGVELRREDR